MLSRIYIYFFSIAGRIIYYILLTKNIKGCLIQARMKNDEFPAETKTGH